MSVFIICGFLLVILNGVGFDRMSVTNAISGMVGVGGLFVMGGGYFPQTIPQVLGALSVLLASVNVSGGFVITKRMLDMFKRLCHSSGAHYNKELTPYRTGRGDPPEYAWLYGVPAVVFTGAFLLAAQTGMAGLVQAGYLTSSILCIGLFFHHEIEASYSPLGPHQVPSQVLPLRPQLVRATFSAS